ncbi:TetR/AcrR family transcriptional regulator [Pseudomonas entomophila]|uniref:TetR/AcrR family transcriptional regulator n=1 Tax=Pseudomonas entomophila TaxID=312306 RepID=UPI0023D80F26|nr:TetR/AcrR family transcriptional regulator [Pseudomonas entomophila]MDF0733038.1 TetR/AcrR family transcriptional regulator [Pseudomonas entomophila]
MKVSREQNAQNRERILDTASHLFREKGFNGIGINDLMQAAGLTRGGFYGHFQSKDDLMGQACERGLQMNASDWRATLASAPDGPLAALARFYLSDGHQHSSAKGCVLAALGPDAARQGPEVRAQFTQGVETFLDLLGGDREKAMATLATLVGALVLSRAVDDCALARDLRQAARQAISGAAQ